MSGPSHLAVAANDLGIKRPAAQAPAHASNAITRVVREDAAGILGSDEFWALQWVSFALERGEVLTVVGGNGSAKSALLFTIAGVLRPDTGALTTFGHSATLLTLGSGFPPHLGGHESIHLNAAFLGCGREKIEASLEPIIEFAARAVHSVPVSTYSARLGCPSRHTSSRRSCCSMRVLGVGDASFKEKSRDKVYEVRSRAQALVVVSHHPTSSATSLRTSSGSSAAN